MSESNETSSKSRAKKSTWQDSAIEIGGRFLELAITGVILGGSSALGQKFVSSTSKPLAKLPEGDVIQFRKSGTT